MKGLPTVTRTNQVIAAVLILVIHHVSHVAGAGTADSEGWLPLFDGESLSGWKAAEFPDSFHVRDAMIVCDGPRAHLFYVGDVENARFQNFELKVTAMTKAGADSGVFFHTAYQSDGIPRQGHEVQINNSGTGTGNDSDVCRTGGLYAVRNQYLNLVGDDQWFTLHVVVTGRRIRIAIDDTLLVDYTEPLPVTGPHRTGGRGLSRGTFALQCNRAGNKAFFKEILVKPLPDDSDASATASSTADPRDRQILRLHRNNFPLIDFHVHLKGGLTLEDALAHSRQTGITYGIAPNCGVGFPITNDQGIHEYLGRMQGQPVFLGMQAEGREWVNMFSKDAIEKFDYVFTDAMTFTDDTGKRIRLWVDEEVDIPDAQAFMDMYVDRIVSVLRDEPINIYVNATFLPTCIADKYDELWTAERMDQVINAAITHDIAIEINARYRIPSPKFIRRAKRAGAKFTFGTNNGDRNLGRLEYCLDVLESCGLTAGDMFVPHRVPASL